MRHRRLALPVVAGLALAAPQARAVDAFFPEFGNDGYDVQNYALTFDVDAAHRITARAVLTVRATAKLSGFALDLSGLEVDEVRVDGTPARFSRTAGKLQVQPATTIRNGATFEVAVVYHGTPVGIDDPTSSDPKILRLGWLNSKQTSYAVSEPEGALTYYPVNDEPTDKATYRIEVVVDKPYTAVSNGPLTSVTDEGARRRFVWEMRQPMASYLATLDIAPDYQLETARSASGIPVRTYTTPNTPLPEVRAFRQAPAMIDFLEPLLGPYPFAAFGNVVARDPKLYYSLETQTMVNYPEDAGIDEVTVVHELAHQWFGDAVTVAEWRDLWLAEGFATYVEILWPNRASPAAFDAAMRDLYASVVKKQVGPAVVSRPEDIFADNTYERGALTLYALRLKVGDTAFYRILRSYYATYRYRNATSADFIDVATTVGNTPGVPELLHAWLYEEPVPPLPGAATARAPCVASATAVTPAHGVRRR